MLAEKSAAGCDLTSVTFIRACFVNAPNSGQVCV